MMILMISVVYKCKLKCKYNDILIVLIVLTVFLKLFLSTVPQKICSDNENLIILPRIFVCFVCNKACNGNGVN